MSILAASISLAPAAVADSTDNLRAALMTLRQATSCGPLRSVPEVERGAEVIARATDRWVNFTARAKPIDIPEPAINVLRDLGYDGTRAKQLQGGAPTDAVAIKAVLLEGFSPIEGDAAIANCTYTDYGASVLQNQKTGDILVAVILAGP